MKHNINNHFPMSSEMMSYNVQVLLLHFFENTSI
jgi:hypothetical protein